MTVACMRRIAALRPSTMASALAAVLAVAGPIAQATPTTWTVNNCNEASTTTGPTTGSLRFVLAHAASGDTVDMTGLANVCSVISLATGALAVGQDTLFVYGPGQDKLAIDAALLTTRAITHTGIGTLYLSGVTVKNGTLSGGGGQVYGGCLFSAGSVSVSYSTVYGCKATATAGNLAAGGGIFALHGVALDHAVVRDNHVYAPAGGQAHGGGVANTTLATFSASYSTIADNQASTNSSLALGGGLWIQNGGTISNSTISGNTSNGSWGGFRIAGGTTSKDVFITNSTISGNSSQQYYGGGATLGANAVVTNTTIAFNHTNNPSTSDPRLAGFVANNQGAPNNYTVELESTLASGNTFGAGSIDFFLFGDLTKFSGANNLSAAMYQGFTLPGIVSGSCALLGPLRANGGATKTHALLSGSPGIDQGNNARSLATDQRGAPFLRMSGIQPDMGAYEVQHADTVFDADFDGCGI